MRLARLRCTGWRSSLNHCMALFAHRFHSLSLCKVMSSSSGGSGAPATFLPTAVLVQNALSSGALAGETDNKQRKQQRRHSSSVLVFVFFFVAADPSSTAPANGAIPLSSSPSLSASTQSSPDGFSCVLWFYSALTTTENTDSLATTTSRKLPAHTHSTRRFSQPVRGCWRCCPTTISLLQRRAM